ncbi:unnamed protein product [Pylaiella littoralis]
MEDYFKTNREMLSVFFEATNGPAWKNTSGSGTDVDISDWHGVRAIMRRVDRLGDFMTNREALGPAWKNTSGWGTDADISDWHGVTADIMGRVNKLGLSDNGLNGSIPTGVAQLRWLRTLDLSHNSLEGTIPTELGKCKQLENVDLCYNSLEGELPAALGNLHHLKYLNLRKNRPVGKIPPELGGLERLWMLDLSFNFLVGDLPATLGNLQRLTSVNLSNNELNGFSKEVAASLLRIEIMPAIATQNNPWEKPPQAVVEAGLKAIIRYFEDIERSGSLESWMLKVVFCAGKSSVVENLIAGEPRPVPLARRTRGVDVHVEHPFKPDPSKPVEFVFWDFAGHDDYHPTHSLFLSNGALFLLVVNLAQFVDDPLSRGGSIYIWLDTLLCRTPGAVVQIVETHTDQRIDDQEGAVEELREVVAGHLAAKRLEHKRGWEKHGREEGDMPAPPILKIVRKIRAVSCTTGNDWLAFGEVMAHLAVEGNVDHLCKPSSNADQPTGRKEGKLFLSMGQEIPTIWARAGAVMNALRDGTDHFHAATLPPQHGTWKGRMVNAQVGCVSWEEAVEEWEKALTALGSSNELGPEGATVVLKDMIGLKVREGMFLFENGLLHLDPTWINDLLRAILDHRLQDLSETHFWEKTLETFTDRHKLKYNQLSNTHQTFCAKGTLTVSLKFLWRGVEGIQTDEVLERVLRTLMAHGVLFSEPNVFLAEPEAGSIKISAALFVPVRLQRHANKERLEEFSALCNEWRRQLCFAYVKATFLQGSLGCVWPDFLLSKVLGSSMLGAVVFRSRWAVARSCFLSSLQRRATERRRSRST